MKLRHSRRALATVLGLMTLLGALSLSILPAAANSAQRYFVGTNASGLIVRGEHSPITVEHEELTFKLDSVSNYIGNEEAAAAYSSTVTAAYTFKNPSDMTITARLLFPFGNRPDYLSSSAAAAMEQKYDITVDGESIDYTVRHTYSPYGRKFELQRDLAALRDDYTSDSFFYPDMTVTRYTFRMADIEDMDRTVNLAFDLPSDTQGLRILWSEQSGLHLQSDGDMRLSAWARDLDTFDIYVIGGKFNTMPVWMLYKDGGVEDKETLPGVIPGEMVETVGISTGTLRELVMASRPEGSTVSDIDWYNAVIDSFNENLRGHELLLSYYGGDYVSENELMCWYEYDLTLEAGQSVINAVTAPMYPDIDDGYTPSICTYTYLLSPASTWDSFGTLSINIETPYYMIEDPAAADSSAVSGFTRTETGYSLTRSGLPEGELVFTLSASESPEYTYSSGTGKVVAMIILGLVGTVLAGLAVVAGVVVLVVLLVKRRRRGVR